MDYILTYDDELYHHGIKGMKWGVRRFQNYDGSYTKKGLARYQKASDAYDAARAKTKAAKQKYNTARYDTSYDGTPGMARQAAKVNKLKSDYDNARRSEKAAKKQLRSDYKRLKNDYRADKGKEQYANGRTINGNKKRVTAAMVGWYLGEFATYSLYSSGKLSGGATMNINRGIRAATALGLGKVAYDNRNLRAYYAHS